jgi:hypothetical protein
MDDLIQYLPYLLAAAIVGLFAYVNYLHGRIQAQSKMIVVMINSLRRLEEQIYQSGFPK